MGRWRALLVLLALVAAGCTSDHRDEIVPSSAVGPATLLVSAPIGGGRIAHAWVAASSDGGECYLVTVDRVRAPTQPAAHHEVSCGPTSLEASMPVSRSTPLSLVLSIETRGPQAAQWVPPIVSGFVLPQLHASRVQLEWSGGSHRLGLRGSSFIGGGSFLYAPPFATLPYFVVAYDDRGRVVAQAKLGSPGLYPNLKAWKEFSPAYLRWTSSQPAQ
jgi:hypothetical protein